MSRFSSALVAAFAVFSACGGSTASPEDEPGLVAGSYVISFEVFGSLTTPASSVGRHRVVFRMGSGLGAEDMSVVSSRRVPPEGPTESDYLEMDTERLQISPDRWIVRFASVDETYTVSFSLGDAGFGNFRVLTGCVVRVPGGAEIQASGCVADRG